MSPIAMHRRALAAFEDRLSTVTGGDWAAPTPCAGWDVRGLLNHVVAGNYWVAPLLAGRRIDEVPGLDGDVLGDDPVAAFHASAQVALAAFDRPGAATATVHAAAGEFPGEEYAWQRLADVLIHTWDLAVATGGDRALPGDLVAAVDQWFTEELELAIRQAGQIGERAPVPPDADTQARLLARAGRSAATSR